MPAPITSLLSVDRKGRQCEIVPGCYDRVSAALVQAAGFTAAGLSGACMQAVSSGFGDISLEDVRQATDTVAAAVDIPVIVDGEDGFGSPVQSVLALLAAGAAAVHLEDMRSGELVDAEEFASTLASVVDAVAARHPDRAVIARTDGLRASPDEAVRRALIYADAGAHAVLPFLGPLLTGPAASRTALLAFLERLATAVPAAVIAYSPLGVDFGRADCVAAGVQMYTVPYLLLGTAAASGTRALEALGRPELVDRFVEEEGSWGLPQLRELPAAAAASVGRGKQ
jgi:2-methylisocitrate lyase-like PEP mutase family enzyme